MTRVEYQILKNSVHIHITGHAGYAERGNDIVCSAISILIQTAIAHMDRVADKYDYSLDEGYAELEAEGYDAKVAVETIITGFELLADNYPEYIEISAL